jgi:hypothetical protein
MIRKDIMKICKQAICKDFGSLNDLPHELANTVANIFYKYLSLSFETSQAVDTPNSIPTSAHRVQGIGTWLISLFTDQQDIRLDFDLVPDLINSVRMCDRDKQPDVYKRMVDFSLFILKYHIKDALNKSYLRLRIERYLARNNVQEIPNLIDLMHLKNVKKKPQKSRKKKNRAAECKLIPKKAKISKVALPPSKRK